MDSIQFGRWIGNQRRRCGWTSQRKLVEEIRQNPFLGETGISEDFLARLEAGQLAHPFRNTVRQRVLLLASFLCNNQNDLRAYLRLAEIDNLSVDEREQMQRLNEHLKQLAVTTQPLPPRPLYTFGREELLTSICDSLATMGSGVCALTGMVGIGKTTLAYEVLHHLNDDQRAFRQLFAHGCATFSCAGRHGRSGLLSLLDEIAAVYGPRALELRAAGSLEGASGYPAEVELARAIQRTQQVLAQKSLLILLDHVEADFPLREAREALLSLEQSGSKAVAAPPAFRHVLLITSCYIPAPMLINQHFHLPPLECDAALKLFHAVLGQSGTPESLESGAQICAAVGYLPLAIEVAATAVAAKGIPLELMAGQVANFPLAAILDSERELQNRLEQSLSVLDPEKRQQFVQLSRLGQAEFDLESAARVYEREEPGAGEELRSIEGAAEEAEPERLPRSGERPAQQQLAVAAANLGIFVRHSLIELVSRPRSTRSHLSAPEQPRYYLSPLFYAYARASREEACAEA